MVCPGLAVAMVAGNGPAASARRRWMVPNRPTRLKRAIRFIAAIRAHIVLPGAQPANMHILVTQSPRRLGDRAVRNPNRGESRPSARPRPVMAGVDSLQDRNE